jgi:hypothetical protein
LGQIKGEAKGAKGGQPAARGGMQASGWRPAGSCLNPLAGPSLSTAPPQAADLAEQLTTAAEERERIAHRSAELEAELAAVRSQGQQEQERLQRRAAELESALAAARGSAEQARQRA